MFISLIFKFKILMQVTVLDSSKATELNYADQPC